MSTSLAPRCPVSILDTLLAGHCILVANSCASMPVDLRRCFRPSPSSRASAVASRVPMRTNVLVLLGDTSWLGEFHSKGSVVAGSFTGCNFLPGCRTRLHWAFLRQLAEPVNLLEGRWIIRRYCEWRRGWWGRWGFGRRPRGDPMGEGE